MQISKVKYDEMVDEIENLKAQVQYGREQRLIFERSLGTVDDILSKIVRAATGLPINVNHGMNPGLTPGDFGVNYAGSNQNMHRCEPPSELEMLRWELSSARDGLSTMEMRLAAVIAVAEFAKEHKA